MPLVPPGLVRDEVFEIGVADGRGENVKRRFWFFSSLLPLSEIRRPIFAFFLSLPVSVSVFSCAADEELKDREIGEHRDTLSMCKRKARRGKHRSSQENRLIKVPLKSHEMSQRFDHQEGY